MELGDNVEEEKEEGHNVVQTVKVDLQSALQEEVIGGDVADQQLAGMMGDAPPCPTCGHITIRSGSCYKCLNCGSTTGCS